MRYILYTPRTLQNYVSFVHSSITLASPSIYHISTSRYMTIINHDVALSTHQLSLEFYIYAMPIHGSVCRNAPRVLHFSAFIPTVVCYSLCIVTFLYVPSPVVSKADDAPYYNTLNNAPFRKDRLAVHDILSTSNV